MPRPARAGQRAVTHARHVLRSPLRRSAAGPGQDHSQSRSRRKCSERICSRVLSIRSPSDTRTSYRTSAAPRSRCRSLQAHVRAPGRGLAMGVGPGPGPSAIRSQRAAAAAWPCGNARDGRRLWPVGCSGERRPIGRRGSTAHRCCARSRVACRAFRLVTGREPSPARVYSGQSIRSASSAGPSSISPLVSSGRYSPSGPSPSQCTRRSCGSTISSSFTPRLA